MPLLTDETMNILRKLNISSNDAISITGKVFDEYLQDCLTCGGDDGIVSVNDFRNWLSVIYLS